VQTGAAAAKFPEASAGNKIAGRVVCWGASSGGPGGGGLLRDVQSLSRFEQAVLPHLDAAFNLARWLTGNDHDAADVVQEAYLRALRYGVGDRGDSRAWVLAVVRNTCFTWLKRNRPPEPAVPFDEGRHSPGGEPADPGGALVRQADRETIRAAVAELPAEFREVIVLRELEGLSYKEIAAAAGVPIGTVMSRLTRARQRLRERLAPPSEGR
jgi:RNA polymerase sigma-70 factor, ECF subfamily